MNNLLPLLQNPYLITFLSVWELVWKGFALWRAGGDKQRNWFIALLIFNTVGILPILYLFVFNPKKKLVEVQG
jgi:hypothetical protein